MLSADWKAIAAFGTIAWLIFSVFAKLGIGRIQPVAMAIAGIAGVAAGMTAGSYAEQTWITTIIRGVIFFHPVVTFAAFIALIVVPFVTLAGVIPDQWSPAIAAGLGLAILWIFVPAALATGVLTGTWGHAITTTVASVTTALHQATVGAWG